MPNELHISNTKTISFHGTVFMEILAKKSQNGHVTLGVSLSVLNIHGFKEINTSPFGFVPKGNDLATWIYPNLVCIVESMPTEKEAFRQPVFKGIRDDKSPYECKVKK